ncbi:bZIP transcription factor HapX [Aspergillus clavatus NRRL 1]|uniref:BZIP transcription factor (HapX), putative n=1 Tax=Aspergillus clavatus (strain ATCC 1007 / CBS 513.65 / DSM 816 / NCTC 3887 / NRRL 1 / QM 1276 / 107) TaxID=344612 RepID=A1C4U3_ASPCL|nr:bZIP transcription factor (HapX), putative [Aspergillus clavatus NRRL 1]EAW14711.1 bZIP transcription factor (HapX), putative [Aspergillus clavatus NRRL 1]
MSAPSMAPTPAPASLAPALAAKPAVSPSPGPGTPGSITTKEWVIPPRPKPGRKPATDTPPTKRKAQNRAAQRAFRERRAARVNELEDQIKKIEDEHDIHIAAFKEQIGNLSCEVEQCRSEMTWWRDRCHTLEKEVSVERSAKEALVKEFRLSLSDKNAASSDAVPFPRATSSRPENDGVPANNASHDDGHHSDNREEVPLGCNDCSTSHCQCIEDAFAMPGVLAQEESRRPGSTKPGRLEPEIKPDPEEMEIDFTARFATMKPQDHSPTSVSSPAVDPCGFCQDGTPCICAEMAAQQEENERRNTFENNRLAPIQNMSQFTPPPSDGDVRSEMTLPSLSQATNPCANGPGTCAQCLADPRSTLFCKTLAASRSASGTPSGCCGGKGAGGGCCQSRSSNPSRSGSTGNANSIPGPSTTPSLTLSCADAFTTLSRHPSFTRATDDISNWLPKLHTLPNPRDIPLSDRGTPRAAMEVEAASVMGVLRYFDRRFADK